MPRQKKTNATKAADTVEEPTDIPEEPTDIPDIPEEPTDIPDIPEEPTDIPKAEQTATAPDVDPDGVENPTPQTQDPTPETSPDWSGKADSPETEAESANPTALPDLDGETPFPTPEAQDPTPEAFTPYQAEVIPALLVVRKEPDGPAVATLTHGAVIRVTGRRGEYAQMENGLYVREGMIRPMETAKT